MGSSPSRPKFADAGPTIAPGANPPDLNQRRDINVARPCDMGNLLQYVTADRSFVSSLVLIYLHRANTYTGAYYSQKPGIVLAGGIFIAVLLVMIVVMIYTLIKRRKVWAYFCDYRGMSLISFIGRAKRSQAYCRALAIGERAGKILRRGYLVFECVKV